MPPTFVLLFMVFPFVFVATFVAAVGAFVPLRKMFRRLGLNPKRAYWLYVPFLNVLFLWKLANEHWPNIRAGDTDA